MYMIYLTITVCAYIFWADSILNKNILFELLMTFSCYQYFSRIHSINKGVSIEIA